MNNNWILAQANPNLPDGIEAQGIDQQQTLVITKADDPNLATEKGSKTSPLMSLLPMILIFVLIYFMMFRGPKKQQKEHKKMVQKLSKNDRIRTIGGIMGTVVDIKDDEIVLKVDESNNTKIRITKNAIGKNLSQEK